MNVLDLINQNPKTGRISSQNFTLKELYKRFDFNSINIVETGCIRNPNDNNSHHLFNCMSLVRYSPRVFYIHNDSVEFLKNLPLSFRI